MKVPSFPCVLLHSFPAVMKKLLVAEKVLLVAEKVFVWLVSVWYYYVCLFLCLACFGFVSLDGKKEFDEWDGASEDGCLNQLCVGCVYRHPAALRCCDLAFFFVCVLLWFPLSPSLLFLFPPSGLFLPTHGCVVPFPTLFSLYDPLFSPSSHSFFALIPLFSLDVYRLNRSTIMSRYFEENRHL